MKSWTYAKAGVPHLKGDPSYNRKISQIVRSTSIPGVLGSATGFASLFDPKRTGVKDPLLVASTDGVGTKLEIAGLQGRHNTIGIDLVAMCVNDLITCGAKPVFFLDYFATGKFNRRAMGDILTGIARGCRQAGCALVGGETAIMPGFYRVSAGYRNNVGHYDLAGFSVGIVDRRKLIDGRKIRKGDRMLGLASSGFHSNGFSLLRKLFSKKQLRGRIGKTLLTPTRIYVQPVLEAVRSVPVSGIVNITGGGFPDNLPRVIPSGLGARLLKGSWPVPKMFKFVQDSGKIPDSEMMRTFNLGIGMVLILKRTHVSGVQRILRRHKISSWDIGEIVKGKGVSLA